MPQPQQARSRVRAPCGRLPRFSRVLSCTHHVHSELHSAAAPSLDALNPSEALTSVACAMAQPQRVCLLTARSLYVQVPFDAARELDAAGAWQHTCKRL